MYFDKEWVDKVYPFFLPKMLVLCVTLLIVTILLIIVTVFGEADTGENGGTWWIVALIAYSVVASVCVLLVMFQVVFRHKVRGRVFVAHSGSGLVFRWGKELDADEMSFAESIVRIFFEREYPAKILAAYWEHTKDKSTMWKPLTFVTFRREGKVKQKVGEKLIGRRGLKRGQWIETSLLKTKNERDSDLSLGGVYSHENTMNLLAHELLHVPLMNLRPGFSAQDRHVHIVKIMGNLKSRLAIK